MSDGLPQGWAYAELKELCTSFDYGTSAKSQPTGRIPVLRMGNIQSGKIDWTDLAYTSDPDEIRKYSLKPNTVLFNRTNSPQLVGKTAIFRGERKSIFAGYLIRVNPLPCLDPRYLSHCLNTDYAREYCYRVKTDGVSQSNINAQKLAAFEIPFCSLAEQKRIVTKLDVLLDKVDTCHKRLEKIPVILKRFRQSVLAAAGSGRLTADWREQNGFSDETRLIERMDLQVPSIWESFPLGELTRFIDYRGRTPEKVESGVPLITAKNIRMGYIDREPREYIQAGDYPSWMTRGIPIIGDVLITTEAPLGYAAAVDLREKFALAQRVICLQFHERQNQGFALVFILSPVFQAMLRDQATGSTVSGIKASRLKQLCIPLPPLPEQHEIVRRVKTLFALANQIETRYTKAKTHIDRLTQSILAKAFRGDLVPQDPNDEPATVLLARIRSQRQEVDVRRRQPKCKRATAAGTAEAPSPHNLT